MNLQGQQKKGKLGKGSNFNDGGGGAEEENVLVAVKASKEIPKAALIWALTHVVQPGDCISLLVVVPPQGSGRRLWVFPRFAGDCASTNKKSHTGSSSTSEQKCDEFTDSCSQMILQLHDVYDPNKVNVKIKVVSSSPCGAVAAEAKRVQANWVVLEKDLKSEEKRCMEDLHCNIVAMRRSHPKVLRLNLVGSSSKELEYPESNAYSVEYCTKSSKENSSLLCPTRGPSVTPSSSPDPFTSTEAGTSSVSSSDPGTSPFFIPETLHNTELSKKDDSYFIARKERRELLESVGLDTESDISTPRSTTSSMSRPWMMGEYFKTQRINQEDHQISPARALLDKLSKLEKGPYDGPQSYMSETDFLTSMREAMTVPRSGPMGPPPLCSICQHKAPVFGKPPRQFSYGELEFATRGFSRANFLAEGGFGSVHRGVLPDGQPIAVKQHKLASSQGDVEFCSEVEVLSCAQHRNVVMLIGYCIEDKRRLLVYEYICNGSLDSHLYGRSRDPLEWYARQRIAVGAARGLRYLHEECRVGCIIHRDMRPNNILLTHDYEPLVGDFGLARWQPDGDTGVQTRVIGTFGYLAPEYAQSGQITEKTDVYSFGVVLVELITGRKAVDLSRPKGQQCLTEWARPLLEDYAIDELIDPVLGDRYTEQEVNCMVRAASLCIMRDPHSRPRMSQVLRILEGDVFSESSYMSTPSYDGNRSGRLLQVDQDRAQCYSGSLLKDESEVYKGNNFTCKSVRCALWAREKSQQGS